MGCGAHSNRLRTTTTRPAAEDISAVSGACLTLDAGSGGGLAYPFDFPDPDVILAGNTYFAYATNSVAGNIQIIQSTNLTSWTAVGNALPALPSWAAPDATWAPAVALIGGAYVLYYAALVAGPGGGEECISVATATQPQGPFNDSSTAPLECQPALAGSIDPSPFIDTDGKVYLTWKSNGGTGPATLWSEQLNVVRHRIRHRCQPDPTAGPRPGVGGGHHRSTRSGHQRRPLSPLLLREQLEQRQLRNRCGHLHRAPRPLLRRIGPAHSLRHLEHGGNRR